MSHTVSRILAWRGCRGSGFLPERRWNCRLLVVLGRKGPSRLVVGSVTVKERVACARPSFDLPTVGWKVIITRNSYSVVSAGRWVASVFCRSVLAPVVQKLPCRALSFHVVLKDCPVIIGLSDAKRESYNLFELETSLRELRDAPGHRRDLDVKWRPRKSGRDGELFYFRSIIVHGLTSTRVRNHVVLTALGKNSEST